MDREELRQRLDQLLKQRPFQPFRLVLHVGNPVDVRFPRLTLLGKGHITVGIVERETQEPVPLYDYTSTILFHGIKNVEILPQHHPAI